MATAVPSHAEPNERLGMASCIATAPPFAHSMPNHQYIPPEQKELICCLSLSVSGWKSCGMLLVLYPSDLQVLYTSSSRSPGLCRQDREKWPLEYWIQY
jgi:hypothetical protein